MVSKEEEKCNRIEMFYGFYGFRAEGSSENLIGEGELDLRYSGDSRTYCCRGVNALQASQKRGPCRFQLTQQNALWTFLTLRD